MCGKRSTFSHTLCQDDARQSRSGMHLPEDDAIPHKLQLAAPDVVFPGVFVLNFGNFCTHWWAFAQ